MEIEFSFTGLVYSPLIFALAFMAYRFFKDWQKNMSIDSRIYFFTFALMSIICLMGTLAGSIFSHSAEGIRWMLILSSFLLTLQTPAMVTCFFT